AAYRRRLPCFGAHIGQQLVAVHFCPITPEPLIGVYGGGTRHVAVAARGVGNRERMSRRGVVKVREFIGASHLVIAQKTCLAPAGSGAPSGTSATFRAGDDVMLPPSLVPWPRLLGSLPVRS